MHIFWSKTPKEENNHLQDLVLDEVQLFPLLIKHVIQNQTLDIVIITTLAYTM
jgi:hypothetical protein